MICALKNLLSEFGLLFMANIPNLNGSEVQIYGFGDIHSDVEVAVMKFAQKRKQETGL